jgi:membrane-associated protease RseP (regulator of RpoE activity)
VRQPEAEENANASLLLALVAKATIGDVVASGHYLVPHPLAFAGWLDVMITALNLLPVGQLDGGHVARALFGRERAQWLGKVALGAMFLLGVFVWSGVLLWALIVYVVAGTRGAAPLDDETPLDPRRRALAWASFAILAHPAAVPARALVGFALHCPYL